MKTLSDMGPSKLHPAEQDRIRAAADSLLFADDMLTDDHARRALEDVRRLADMLVDAERWLTDSADRLIHNLEGCGPLLVAV